MKAITARKNDLWIMGPSLSDSSEALNVLFALHYLPKNYKLVFPGSEAADAGFVTKLNQLVVRDNLRRRVVFANDIPHTQVVQLAKASGANDSPEAWASAILNNTYHRA